MIEEIHLKNYRSCKDVKIRFGSPFMALIGKNAAGKTNTLKGIKAASVCWSPHLINRAMLPDGEIPQKGFGAKFIFNIGGKKSIYEYKYYGTEKLYVKDSLKVKKNKEKSVTIFEKKSQFKLEILNSKAEIYLPSDFSALSFFIDIFSQDGDHELKREMKGHRKILKEVFERIYGITYYDNNISEIRVEPTNLISFPEKNGQNLSYKFDELYKKDTENFNEFKEIFISLGLVNNIKRIKKEDPFTRSSIYWLFNVHNMGELEFNQLSQGTKRMIHLLFCLFYDKSSLMMIEEPETSVHWGLLVKFLDILQQYGHKKRILISTHSEQILNKLQPEQLIYIYIENGCTKTRYITGKTLKTIRKYMDEVGTLGEYATSGELEAMLDV